MFVAGGIFGGSTESRYDFWILRFVVMIWMRLVPTEAKQRAEEDLKDKASDIDYARAQSELSVAVAQLAALEKLAQNSINKAN